ncbi:MAG: DUF4434 domain-containing protein [Victivallaceae bacterium]|jgi:hypothetical protein
MRITATFLDEISTDIPHQNWGYAEWDLDFQAMQRIGINTVVMIRCGLERFITYPSKIMVAECGAYLPPVDLVDMFLELAEKYGMRFFFGTYVGHREWCDGGIDYKKEVDLDKRIVNEAWGLYGHRKAFKGWYLSKEISVNVKPIVHEFVELGRFCKEISGNLPVMISPGMLGRKAWLPTDKDAHDLDFERHYREWDEIMGTIAGNVDIVAFQDGHVHFWELPEVLKINKALADKHGLDCWTNSETFDRDMPFRFPPIKWEKLLLKLKAAEAAGIKNTMTFEFSHFMSPNSFWPQAGNLYNRYREYLLTVNP